MCQLLIKNIHYWHNRHFFHELCTFTWERTHLLNEFLVKNIYLWCNFEWYHKPYIYALINALCCGMNFSWKIFISYVLLVGITSRTYSLCNELTCWMYFFCKVFLSDVVLRGITSHTHIRFFGDPIVDSITNRKYSFLILFSMFV